jgi:hypothetical protein
MCVAAIPNLDDFCEGKDSQKKQQQRAAIDEQVTIKAMYTARSSSLARAPALRNVRVVCLCTMDCIAALELLKEGSVVHLCVFFWFVSINLSSPPCVIFQKSQCFSKSSWYYACPGAKQKRNAVHDFTSSGRPSRNGVPCDLLSLFLGKSFVCFHTTRRFELTRVAPLVPFHRKTKPYLFPDTFQEGTCQSATWVDVPEVSLSHYSQSDASVSCDNSRDSSE